MSPVLVSLCGLCHVFHVLLASIQWALRRAPHTHSGTRMCKPDSGGLVAGV